MTGRARFAHGYVAVELHDELKAQRDSLQARLDELLEAVDLHCAKRSMHYPSLPNRDKALYAVAQKVREDRS